MTGRFTPKPWRRQNREPPAAPISVGIGADRGPPASAHPEEGAAYPGSPGARASIQADAGSFDYSRFSDLSFVLIDVDLYIPVLGALERVWPQMARDAGVERKATTSATSSGVT